MRLSPRPPHFLGMQRKANHLLATVSDQESQLWLLTYQEQIAEASGCPLKVVYANDVPSPPRKFIYKGSFSHSAENTDKDILYTLESYSWDFIPKATSWEVIRRVNEDHRAFLCVSVDERSADYIKERDGALPFRLGTVLLHRVWNTFPTPDPVAEPSTPHLREETPTPDTRSLPSLGARTQTIPEALRRSERKAKDLPKKR